MTWCRAPRAHPDPHLRVPCLPLTSDLTLLGGLVLCVWGQHGLPRVQEGQCIQGQVFGVGDLCAAAAPLQGTQGQLACELQLQL